MNRTGNNVFADIVIYSMAVGALLVMTRPGSQGPALVGSATTGYSNIVKAATGQ